MKEACPADRQGKPHSAYRFLDPIFPELSDNACNRQTSQMHNPIFLSCELIIKSDDLGIPFVDVNRQFKSEKCFFGVQMQRKKPN